MDHKIKLFRQAGKEIMALALGIGSINHTDVMRRIALPMVGGMVSTMVLTLILIPVLYAVYMQWKLKLRA